MTLRKLLKIVFGLLILLTVAVGLISINHPIILKWVTGSVRHFGRSIPAAIYTNGQLNDDMKLFYTDEPNSYLLSVTGRDSSAGVTFFNIDLSGKRVSRTLGMSENDYDFIAGHLFQSKEAALFSPFQDGRTGIAFDPQLSFTRKEIKFNVPPGKLNFDSIRIELQ